MKFGSATFKLGLSGALNYEPLPVGNVGDVVVCEVMTENASYPNLEQPDGTLTKVNVGDKIVGVLGSRQALRGFVGQAPASLCKYMRLSLLNMGGVIGHYIDAVSSLGEPAQVRYLGTVVDEQGPVSIKRVALPEAEQILKWRPLILVLGTCMHVGKTVTVSKLIETATQAGFQVGAAKVSGVGAIKDLKNFWEAGAVDVKSFIDCGLPSTVDAENLAPIVKTVVNAVEGDLVIVEFGDGIMGHYKVETVLNDADIMNHVSGIVVCAGDLMGAYGAKVYLDQLGVKFQAFSGLATENVSGSDYIEEKLGLPAINGLKHPKKLFATLGINRGFGKTAQAPTNGHVSSISNTGTLPFSIVKEAALG